MDWEHNKKLEQSKSNVLALMMLDGKQLLNFLLQSDPVTTNVQHVGIQITILVCNAERDIIFWELNAMIFALSVLTPMKS